MKYSKQHSRYTPKNFIYGFLGKTFPVSPLTLNDKSSIQEHRQLLSVETKSPEDSFCFLKQTHGNKCYIVTNQNFASQISDGDAMATNLNNVILTVHTADCIPVLFFDENQQNVAIAHAGWRGAFQGIIQHTIQALQKLHSNPKDIKVVIGPCIEQSSYEVDKVFFEMFIDHNHANKKFFIPSNRIDHFLFDLPNFVYEILTKQGIEQIFYLGENTYNSKDWFSFRESTHKNLKTNGRIISFIGIRKHND